MLFYCKCNFLDEFDLDGDYLTPPAPCEEFDQVVGELENILVEDDFLKLQNDLLEKHYHHFEVNRDFFTFVLK